MLSTILFISGLCLFLAILSNQEDEDSGGGGDNHYPAFGEEQLSDKKQQLIATFSIDIPGNMMQPKADPTNRNN